HIFRPTIVNSTATTLLMGVNEGLQSQNRCNCTVAAGSSGTSIGYYRLFSNSNVRAYNNGSGYTGGYIYWENFASSVDGSTGDVTLRATSSPAADLASVPGGPIDAGTSGVSLAQRSDVLDVPRTTKDEIRAPRTG